MNMITKYFPKRINKTNHKIEKNIFVRDIITKDKNVVKNFFKQYSLFIGFYLIMTIISFVAFALGNLNLDESIFLFVFNAFLTWFVATLRD